MTDILKTLVGGQEKLNELGQLDSELKKAIDQLKNLESDWQEKVNQIKIFIGNWTSSSGDLKRIKDNIRVVKELDIDEEEGIFKERMLILSIREVVERLLANGIPVKYRSNLGRIKKSLDSGRAITKFSFVYKLFRLECLNLNKLEKNLQMQLNFINKYYNQDIGVVYHKIREFIGLLKEEGKILGIESRYINQLKQFESFLNENLSFQRKRSEIIKDKIKQYSPFEDSYGVRRRQEVDQYLRTLAEYGFDSKKHPKTARLMLKFLTFSGSNNLIVQILKSNFTIKFEHEFAVAKKEDTAKYEKIPVLAIIHKFNYVEDIFQLEKILLKLSESIGDFANKKYKNYQFLFKLFGRHGSYYFEVYQKHFLSKFYITLLSGFSDFETDNKFVEALEKLKILLKFITNLGSHSFFNYKEEAFNEIFNMLKNIGSQRVSFLLWARVVGSVKKEIDYGEEIKNLSLCVDVFLRIGLDKAIMEICTMQDEKRFYIYAGNFPHLFIENKISIKEFCNLCSVIYQSCEWDNTYERLFTGGSFGLRTADLVLYNYGASEFIRMVKQQVVSDSSANSLRNFFMALSLLNSASRFLTLQEFKDLLEKYRDILAFYFSLSAGLEGRPNTQILGTFNLNSIPGVRLNVKDDVKRFYRVLMEIYGVCLNQPQHTKEYIEKIMKDKDILKYIEGIGDWEVYLQILKSDKGFGIYVIVDLLRNFAINGNFSSLSEVWNKSCFEEYLFWLEEKFFSYEMNVDAAVITAQFSKNYDYNKENFEKFKKFYNNLVKTPTGSYLIGTIKDLFDSLKVDFSMLSWVALISVKICEKYGFDVLKAIPKFKELYDKDFKKLVALAGVIHQMHDLTKEEDRDSLFATPITYKNIMLKHDYFGFPEYAKEAKPENAKIFFVSLLPTCEALIDKYGLDKIAREFANPLINAQSITSPEVARILNDIQRLGALNTFDDAMLILHICQKYPTKAIDILKHLLVEGINFGIIPKDLSSEAQTIKYFLQNAPAYILDLYKEYREIITSNSPDRKIRIDSLFRDVFELKEQLYSGNIKEVKNEALFFGVIYHVFPPELSVDRNTYQRTFQSREDRQKDIPERLKRLDYLKVNISKGGYFIKKGEAIDTEPWQDLIDATNAKDKPIAPEKIGLGILNDFVSNTIQKTRKEHLSQVLLYSKEKGESLPSFNQDYTTLMKYKEFIGDRMNDLLYMIMTETQAKFPREYSELIGQIKKSTTDLKGLTKALANLWNSNVTDKLQRAKKILEKNGIFVEDIKWSTPTTPKEIEESLMQTKEGIIEKSLIAKLKQALYGQGYSGMQKEVLKFEFKREGKSRFGSSGKFTFALTKRHAHCIAMFNMGVCVAVDDKLWNSPDMWQLIIFDEHKNGCGGAIYRTVEEQGKKYLIVSIEPSSTLLSSTSPEGVYEKIMDYSKAIVKLLKYEALLIPTSSSIHSNRGSIQTEISKRNYRVLTLDKNYDFSYIPYHYYYKEFFIA